MTTNPGLLEILGDINLKQVEGSATSTTISIPANLADTLQEIREELRDLNNNVKTGRAETANALIRLQNRFVDPMGLHPVQKTVVGSGIQLAKALAPDHASRNAIEQFTTNHCPEFAGEHWLHPTSV